MRRNKVAFLWMCLAIVVGITGQVVAEEAKEITCIGKVVDTKGKPIAGARVSLYQVTSNYTANTAESKLIGEATTISDGLFSFKSAVETDSYSTRGYIVVKKAGLALGWAEWDMRGNQREDIILGEPKELSGIVVDEADIPVPDADVSIWVIAVGEGRDQQGLGRPVAEKLLKETTDTSGRFTFTNIPAEATADFIIRKSGKATIDTFRSTGYADQKLTFAPGQKDIKLVLPIEARIEGAVVAKDTGKPVVGTKLIVTTQGNRPLVEQEPVISKDDGTFSFNSLAAGNYLVQLVRSWQRLAEWVAEPVEVMTETGQVEKNVKIELTKGALLEVLVTEAGTDKPLEGAVVSVYDKRRKKSYSGRTGDDGIGRIRLLPGMYQSGYAYKRGFSTANYQETITAEEDKTKRLECQLTSLPTVTGIVRDNNGKPVKGAMLKVCPMGGMDIKSDAEGKYHVSWDSGIDIHERQPLFLVCRYVEDNLAVITTIPEDAKTLDIDLKPAVIVTGKIVNPDGKGINDARIGIMLRQTAWGSNLTSEAAKTDAEGSFEIKAIPVEHNYDLIIKAKGYGSKRINIHADDAIDNRLKAGVLTLPVANLAVSGFVVDTKGNPIADARIESYNYEGGQPERLISQTDSQGKFIIDGVCEGQLNIRINVDHNRQHLSAHAITNGGASGIKIVVRKGRSVVQYLSAKSYEQIIRDSEKVIAGNVLDENGSPVVRVPVGVCCHKTMRENGEFSWMFSSFTDLKATTDELGRFAIELKEDGQYNLLFSPDHHAALIIYDIPVGKKNLKVTLPKGGTISGRLVRMEKGQKVPIPNVEVKIEQPERTSFTHLGFDRDQTTITDSQGRFRFEHLRTKIRPRRSMSDLEWEHVPRVWEILYGDNSKTVAFYDSTTIEDFELLVKPSLTESQSLIGGALMEFDGIKIDLPSEEVKNKAILVCFFDMNQRPSRNAIIQLIRHTEQLKQKDIAIVAFQVSKIFEDKLNKWIKDRNISFPVGIVSGDEEEIRFTWGVKSLPWLILTDSHHVVSAEGFGIEEIGDKIKNTGN